MTHYDLQKLYTHYRACLSIKIKSLKTLKTQRDRWSSSQLIELSIESVLNLDEPHVANLIEIFYSNVSYLCDSCLFH